MFSENIVTLVLFLMHMFFRKFIFRKCQIHTFTNCFVSIERSIPPPPQKKNSTLPIYVWYSWIRACAHQKLEKQMCATMLTALEKTVCWGGTLSLSHCTPLPPHPCMGPLRIILNATLLHLNLEKPLRWPSLSNPAGGIQIHSWLLNHEINLWYSCKNNVIKVLNRNLLPV